MERPKYQQLDKHMGEAVAARTVLREGENWGDVAARVAHGNVSLLLARNTPDMRDVLSIADLNNEYENLRGHVAAGRVLLSGRHLQHGDENQHTRPGEVMTNCSTAAFSFIKKLLLLSGSGVGRSYDDTLMIVDWSQQPMVFCTLDYDHKDAHYDSDLIPDFWSTKDLRDILSSEPEHKFVTHRVVDSREGWAKAVEQVERMAYLGENDKILILDFSDVRPEGSPIGGMQNRPSSGPLPLMRALKEVNLFREQPDMPRWEQAMRVDHALAEVVMVGGARRAARIATKYWKDPGIFDFINIKQTGGLWTANNSITVDAEFWNLVRSALAKIEGLVTNTSEHPSCEESHALAIYTAVVMAQYTHGSGEPGFINVDKLAQNPKGMEVYDDGLFAGNTRYQLDEATADMGKALFERLKDMPYSVIVNPCGEIVLFVAGGYCVIGDVAPYFADTLDEVIDAVKATTRALIRTNLMEFLYNKETQRTNRIGVSLTGIQEFAWKHFGLAFRDLIDSFEEMYNFDWSRVHLPKGYSFWHFIARLRRAVEDEGERYAKELGVEVPHTMLTIKPAGTTSKLFALTEGAHLPAMLEYLRWVQFKESDPLVAEYEAKGYPVRRNLVNAEGVLKYEGMAIVGFPTEPLITRLGIPRDRLVTAPEATMEEQFQWLMLLEKYWLGEKYANQISYTLKYDKTRVTFGEYARLILDYQSRVRCVSVMASSDVKQSIALYSYIPEEPIPHEEFMELIAGIEAAEETGFDMDTLQCGNGACPI